MKARRNILLEFNVINAAVLPKQCFQTHPQWDVHKRFSNITILTIMRIGRNVERLTFALLDILVIPSQGKIPLFNFCYVGKPHLHLTA